ncbi:MAG TPA: aminotransferase class I/II-fold pyridoxal phosphate-dependent enzyme [Bryobacteraceae bacterium]|nr:aminotransferase class I/II-fold pyridoxal phosphate-dependent enzyme [Bryobacteraceae bacterium]
MRDRFRSARTADFTESVIREMTRLAIRHNAVNLAQGFPDFAAPAEIKSAAQEAIAADINQYAITWGSRTLRDAITRKYASWYELDFDPEREITVCCGATEGMIATLLAVTNPGDEIIVFEPFYENYRPDAMLCGAATRLVSLRSPAWTFDPDELRAAFSARTKAIIVNSPNNPTGRVFTPAELELIASLAEEFDTLVITDEIYEHIIYDGAKHTPIAALPRMRNRTVLVNSMSKTWSVTGWRIGWVIAPPDISDGIRKVHDFLTVGAAAPLQEAGVAALGSSPAYYADLARHYEQRRDLLMGSLQQAGFRPYKPQGAYYILCDIGDFGFENDVRFVQTLIERAGVAAVPGSSFFDNGEDGKQLIRFCFCKSEATLREAGQRLRTFAGQG